uniref:Flp pilus assembly protein CpaB n=1 Tax=Nocardia donostiensis TaxID=1538463 RepID=UPI0009DA1832|nr:Flp pilus assembly protein CpaB [Nocardia donostiensis]
MSRSFTPSRRSTRFGQLGRGRLGHGETWRETLWNRPSWADGTLARRVLAAVFALAAIVLFLRGTADSERVPVLVAARDLPPGHLLQTSDLRTASYEPGALPAGAVGDPSTLTGAVLAAAMRAGEVVTDLRVVGPRLAATAIGTSDGRIVPIRLADNAVTGILRGGDRVDVIAATESAPMNARILASNAAVVLVSGSPKHQEARSSTAERVVLVAMSSRDAAAVAAASLSTALTVVFH